MKLVPFPRKGFCYLELIVPGLRIIPNFPRGLLKNKRAELTNLNDVSANRTGRVSKHDYAKHVNILRLSDALLQFIDETASTTKAILTEFTQVRHLALPNRMALHFFLVVKVDFVT